MKTYVVKTPKIIQALYPNYLWKVITNKKVIFLTFDDGPTPIVTQFVLSTLKKHQIKATFFCIGKNIEKHPKIFNKIINEGHAIGNHTFEHFNGWKTDTNIYINNIEKTQQLINTKIKGSTICHNSKIINKYFRPPFGKIKRSQAKKLITNGYKIAMWSILSGDFDTNLSAKSCLYNVINNTSNGDVIVFHDSEKAFEKLKYVLPKILQYFLDNGYEFKLI